MKVTIQNILNTVQAFKFSGPEDHCIDQLVQLSDKDINGRSLLWCSDKNREALNGLKRGCVIVSQETYDFAVSNGHASSEVYFIVVDNPRLAFMKILNEFFVESPKYGQIAESAVIHESVKYDPEKVNIGHNVVIERGVSIGDHVKIDHNTTVKSDSIIGDNVSIGSNCTIGGVGFGYEMNEKGEYEVIPHIGKVVLRNNVEIGNNVCIDRAVLGSTYLDEHVKVDNLVHIAHGVQIGRNSLVIANSMIAGSVEIGSNVWVSPSVSVIQKTKIGDNALLGMGTIVLKNVEPNTVVAGVPAKKIKDR